MRRALLQLSNLYVQGSFATGPDTIVSILRQSTTGVGLVGNIALYEWGSFAQEKDDGYCRDIVHKSTRCVDLWFRCVNV